MNQLTRKLIYPFRWLIVLRLVHFSFSTWVALGLQTLLLTLCFVFNMSIGEMTVWQRVCFVAVNFLVTIVYFQLIGLVFRNRPTLLRIANSVSLWLFAFLFSWHYFNGGPLDYVMAASNIRDLFYWESLQTISHASSPWALAAVFLVLPAGLVILSIKTTLLSRWPRPAYTRIPLIASIGVLTVICASPAINYHDLTYLGHDAFNYYYTPGECPTTNPNIHDDRRLGVTIKDPAAERPNVLIIMVESFNAHFVGRANENGEEFTPFFNRLRHRGLYIERFYGNSIQTARGQEAVFCGIAPSWGKKQAEYFPLRKMYGLPAVLRDAGYRTFFFQAQADITFDNTLNFMHHVGFDSVLSMRDPDPVSKEDEGYVWNCWGIEDTRLYQKAFAHLDRELAPEAHGGKAAGPCFVNFATVNSHMMWDQLPEDRKLLYPGTTTEDCFKNFANAIRLTDRSLEVFFKEFEKRPWLRKNTVLIITGDHSYPDGEHNNNFRNQFGFYEENFRVPMLIIWPGHIEPRVVHDIAYSQLDIAPTLLDLLGIEARHHFVGVSMMKPTTQQHAIPLIQPCSGQYLGVVHYPMKYVRHTITEKEYLFDLGRDEGELTNLADRPECQGAINQLKPEIDRIVQNQSLIENDRIWPEE